MARIGRYELSEISFSRLIYALKERIDEIPHALAWNFSALSTQNKRFLEQYREIHVGERCFIVANGPSLLRTNLDLLSNEFSFGMNRIYLNFDKSSFRPSYFVTINDLILEQCKTDISALPMPKFINWNRQALYGLPSSDLMFIKSKFVIRDSFQGDATHPMVFGATVTFAALQLAYYMGFRKVILIGLDHNYAEKSTPSRVETRISERDESHFHPQYFPKGFKWQPPDLLRSEIEFELARQAYEADGREILDATIGGSCQVFKKVEYGSLFNLTK